MESLLKPAVSNNHLLKRMVRLENKIQLLSAGILVSHYPHILKKRS